MPISIRWSFWSSLCHEIQHPFFLFHLINKIYFLQEGTTPLILASANNHLECVRELLRQGADPQARRLVSATYFSANSNLLNFNFIFIFSFSWDKKELLCTRVTLKVMSPILICCLVMSEVFFDSRGQIVFSFPQ